MDNIVVSILALIIGTFLGGIVAWFIVSMRSSTAMKKANKYLDEAKKEAEKYKRDSLIELKKESHELKQQTEAEIK